MKNLINNRLLPVLLLVFFVTSLSFIGWRASSSGIFETNILKLFPENHQSEKIRFSEGKISQSFERKLVVLVGAGSAQVAVDEARKAGGRLAGSDLFANVITQVDGQAREELLKIYANYQHGLLTGYQRELLGNDSLPALRRHMLSKLYGASVVDISGWSEHDALFFFSDFVAEKIGEDIGRFTLVDGVPTISSDGLHYAIIRIELAESPFALDYQKHVLTNLNLLESEIRSQNEDIKILRSGMIFHAINGAEMAKTEISQIGSISLIGVLLLLTLTFKSIRPFLVVFAVVLSGAAVGFAACLLLFGKVHLLTLVFGTSLIGISVDYSLHFFSERYQKGKWQAQKAISHILSGVTIGLITSAIGFLGLYFTPFSGLQQMSVFCIVGLIFTYLCVVILYPMFFRSMPKLPSEGLYKISAAYQSWWQKRSGFVVRSVVLALIVISACALPFLSGKDDVRAMQPLSTALLKNDLQVSTILDKSISSQFFIISAADDETLLVETQQLSLELDQLKKSGALKSYDSLSNYIPSAKQQMQDADLLKHFVKSNKNGLEQLFAELGFAENIFADYVAYIENLNEETLTIDLLMSQTDIEQIEFLYGGEFERKKLAFVSISSVKDSKLLQQVADEQEAVIFVDKVANLSSLLSDYRSSSALMALVAYIIIFMFLLYRYGLTKGFEVIAPSLLAAFVAIVFAGIIGGSYSLFHVLALFLVMGIGVDYSVFIAENQAKSKITMVAIILSAITTLLSFGLLATSGTSALHDFGITILIGITIVFALSPMVLTKRSEGD